MQIWIYLFAISIALVLYNYAGYAIIARLLTKMSKVPASYPIASAPPPQPRVSFIVAAYNEQDVIEKKILHSLQQDYDPQKIEFLFITDGSTDNTPHIIEKYPAIRLLHQPARNGKSAAVNRAVRIASGDILVFSDANTFLNHEATSLIIAHYADSRVGGVAGEKKVLTTASEGDNVGAGEGLYWKYESLLKRID